MYGNNSNSNNEEEIRIRKINKLLKSGSYNGLYEIVHSAYLSNSSSKYDTSRLLAELLDNPDRVDIDNVLPIANYLLDNYMIPKGDIDINGQTKDGTTALHAAATYNYDKNIHKLLLKLKKAGAYPLLKDTTGKTPYEIAFELGNLEIVALFEALFYTDEQIRQLKEKLSKGNNNIYKNLVLKEKAVVEKPLYNALNRKDKYTNKQINFMRKHVDKLEKGLPHVIVPDTPSISNINDFEITYIMTASKEKNQYMPVMTIPKGTLLFNSYKAPEFDKIEMGVEYDTTVTNIVKFLQGLLPLKTDVKLTEEHLEIDSCLDHFHQVFFYTNPAGGPALSHNFNVTAMFETKKDMRLALLMSPGNYHRLIGEHTEKISCDKMPVQDCLCSTTTDYTNNDGTKKQKCTFGFDYDACMRPGFLEENGLDGHIAIAEADAYSRTNIDISLQDTSKQLKNFDRNFMRNKFSKKYTVPHRILFDYCRSEDDRSPISSLLTKEYEYEINKETNEKKVVDLAKAKLNIIPRVRKEAEVARERRQIVSGFPEIVLHTYGTNWYKDALKKSVKIKKPLPKGENIMEWAAKLMLEYNYSLYDTLGIGFASSIKLIRLSTPKHYFNLENGTIRYALETLDTDALKKYKIFGMYLNILQAYHDGDINWLIDTRNGFLLRPGHLPKVEFYDGSVRDFEDLCIVGTEEEDGTLFERSAKSRELQPFWKKEDCLLFVKGNPKNYEEKPVRSWFGGSSKTQKNRRTGGKSSKTRKRRLHPRT